MRPFSIGTVLVDPPVLLAPMEDVTDVAFRALAKRIGRPGLVFTEFVSSMALHHGARKSLRKMCVRESERPLGIQIFGADPAIMAEGARLAVAMGADLVDVNMGCWVPKVCRTGSGAALLKDPALAERIVRTVVEAVSVPVTVKVRAGWTYELFAAPELARRFEAAGARMLTLHARFARQGFQGEADWRLIEALRAAIAIPLVGNGDVRTPDDALRMFRETGCDGVMVGRAAIGDPWRLGRIVERVSGRPLSPEPPLAERVEVALEHIRRRLEEEERVAAEEASLQGASPSSPEDREVRAIRSLRGQIPLYIKGAPGAASLRARLVEAERYDEIEELLLGFIRSVGSAGAAAEPHTPPALPPVRAVAGV
jgi:nifR3 family TIM-barrel protein